MIGHFFMKNRYKLIKIVKNKHMAVPISGAIDHRYVTSDMVNQDSDKPILPNHSRGRPFLQDLYQDYFCELGTECPSLLGHDCPSGQCREFDDYWNSSDIGFLTGSINGIVVVDLDPRNFKRAKTVGEFKQRLARLYGDLPPTWEVRTARGGVHLYYSYKPSFRSDKGYTIDGCDFLGDGSWCRLPPYGTKHGSYYWSKLPSIKNLAPLPDWIVAEQANKYRMDTYKRPKTMPSYRQQSPVDEREKVQQGLACIPISAAYDHTTFCNIGYALCSSGYEDLFTAWSQTDPDRSKWVTSNQLNAFKKKGQITLATFFSIAKSYG